MDNNNYIKLASFHELQELLKITKANDELMEYLTSSLHYLLYYSKKHNMPLPDSDKIDTIIKKVRILFDKSSIKSIYSPTEFQQRNKTPDDSTEPINFKKYYIKPFKILNYMMI